MRLLICALSLLAFQSAWAELVDINTADASTLDKTMVGIGPQKAAAIVEYRTQHGPFKSVDELDKVPGIGGETLKKNRDKVTVATPSAETAKTPPVETPK